MNPLIADLETTDVRSPAHNMDREREFEPRIRAWRVLHAAGEVRPLIAVMEAQLSAGMKPSVLTSDGIAAPEDFLKQRRSKPASLLSAWNDVRVWRRCLLDAESAAQPRGFEVVHAHCFPAGMAAVRNCPSVVYDISRFIEQQPGAQSQSGEPNWMGRSFRVAEQFVISRAGAVVVHSEAVRRGAIERGAAAENLFHIPSPLAPELLERLESPLPWCSASSDTVNFMAADFSYEAESNANLPEHLELLLQAFAAMIAEGLPVNLYLPAWPMLAGALLERAMALGIADSVHALRASDCARALEFSDVVIFPSAESSTPDSPLTEPLAEALASGCAVLAADQSDMAPHSRGLVWYSSSDVRDLARRAALLARDPELRRSLIQSGRRHLAEARSPEAIGRLYHRAYQRAWSQRRIGGAVNTPGASLETLPQAG